MVTEDQIKRTKALLPKKEIIDFPQYNFKVELNYNDLNDDQLCRAKQEIINAAHGFKEAFGHKELNLINKGMKEKSPNNIREFPIFIYDNRDDFVKYTGSSDGGITYTTFGITCNVKACIKNPITTTAFLYKHNPQGISFISTLQHEFGHQLTAYIGKMVNLSPIIMEGVAHYMKWYPSTAAGIEFDSKIFTDDRLKSLENSKITTGESYSNELHIFMSFLEEKYHRVLNEILLNKWGNYDNALEFFKEKFPDMIRYIPDSDKDSYRAHDKELFNKILENPKVRQDYLNFFSDKIAENKYISKVIDKNASIMIRGDHIGTYKDEEYYTGMIVRCKKIAALDASGKRIEPVVNEVIGSFSPVEYSYSSNGIKAFNHATKDSIIIPKKYHNLKLVKVDCNFKLAFCDQYGNEYRNTTECKNKTKDLIYTDNAQEAFTLVDLYSIKGITGQEENLNKVVFSLKPINSNSKSISVYDGNKNISSFTNEVGYTNRGEFHFKGGCSTEFKVYDKNRALIVVEDKGDGKCKLFLKDGRDIDDRKFQDSNIQLKDTNLDYGCSQDKENEPGKVGAIKFNYHNFTVKLHYGNHLSNDKLQEIINEVKRDPHQFKTLLNIKEQDTTSHELQLYLYPDKRSYQKDTRDH